MQDWKTYKIFDGTEYLYKTAPMKERRYQPGFVNEVKIFPCQGSYEVRYTDGYKTQTLGFFNKLESAKTAGDRAIKEGAGGGFTSFFKPVA